jgi:hypothetical protein
MLVAKFDLLPFVEHNEVLSSPSFSPSQAQLDGLPWFQFSLRTLRLDHGRCLGLIQSRERPER